LRFYVLAATASELRLVMLQRRTSSSLREIKLRHLG